MQWGRSACLVLSCLVQSLWRVSERRSHPPFPKGGRGSLWPAISAGINKRLQHRCRNYLAGARVTKFNYRERAVVDPLINPRLALAQQVGNLGHRVVTFNAQHVYPLACNKLRDNHEATPR